jgi:choline-sulfatase
MPATTNDRPNIICLMSDEHNVHVAGCYDNPVVRTPHLDRLAAEGVTFDAAYTTSPLCVPARLSFTAGKYVSRCGAWNNHAWLASDDVPSLPRLLNNAGYQSYLCGKMHYDTTRRYGFTDLTPELHSNRSTKTGKGGRRRANDQDIDLHQRDSRFADFHPGDHSQILDHDREVTRHAVGFLGERTRDDAPFFMLVGHLAPHFPIIAPQAYWEHYQGKVPMPKLPEGHVAAQPRNYHHLRRGFGIVETDPELVQKGRELYYALTEWFDNEVGKVLAALDDSEAADNTIVIYTSDHGENMGEHGLWWKNCMYEHAARVPLIVRWPERWAGGQRRTQVCSLVDLVQTIAELGGAQTLDDWDGESLCGVMDDPDAAWRDIAVTEYYGHNIASGMAMLRQGQYKYIYHTAPDARHRPECELYDLETDPGEFDNLATRPEYGKQLGRMHEALVKELGRHPDECEQMCRTDYLTGYNR